MTASGPGKIPCPEFFVDHCQYNCCVGALTTSKWPENHEQIVTLNHAGLAFFVSFPYVIGTVK